MLRGNDGQKIFFNDEDRCRMCFLLQDGVEKYGHRVHAFCFMNNHIHLLIQVENISISKIMHNLAFRYSQRINKRYRKVGHLFQGRFKAILISENGYFLKLLRYIHMNPVRANLVSCPQDYKWTGHGAYLEKDHITWLTTEYGLSKFGDEPSNARKLYSNFILEMESSEEIDRIRKGFQDGQVLGEENFLEAIKRMQKKVR